MLNDDLSTKLRSRHQRLQSGDDDIVKKNLMPLRSRIIRRNRALAIYFKKYCQGRSPLLRDACNKLPVRERLGLSTRPERKIPFLGTNTNKLIPCNSRLRRQRREQFRNHDFRKNKEMSNKVSSLKIQVWNDQTASRMNQSPRFRMQLNPNIQLIINQIQTASPRQIFCGINAITPVATNIPLNQRFSSLS